MGERRIGDYEIVRLLGKGGMSEVYEVEHVRLGSHHALKLFACEKEDGDVRRRFETEGRLLARMNHPRIVRVTDLGTDASSGQPYFVMDLILGEDGSVRSLDTIEPGSVDESMIGRWYDDLREGLDYIHAHGVIHRDIKLQNVLIGLDGHAVLTDFGVSKIFAPDAKGKTIVDTVQTIVRMCEGRHLVMGSVGYMAPELEMGVAASRESDWYALGVIVYRLLTGTWCDARTDLAGNLDSYDPVWMKILPKLLHANPSGRSCPSYADEKAALREASDCAAEEELLAAKARGRCARHWARAFAATVAVSVLALCVAVLFGRQEIVRAQLDVNRAQDALERAKLRAQLSGSTSSAQGIPEFDEVFAVPANAQEESVEDDDENIVTYSRAQFQAARIDALVLVHDIFAGVRKGTVTPQAAIERLENLKTRLKRAEEDELEDSPFEQVPAGDGYQQLGETGPILVLFDNAIKQLKAVWDME